MNLVYLRIRTPADVSLNCARLPPPILLGANRRPRRAGIDPGCGPRERHIVGAPGRNRTYDTRFRKPLLYPLSYGGRVA